MEKLLVTTDLSSNSKAAIRFAVNFAIRSKSTMVICHVCEILKPTGWSDKHYKALTTHRKAEITLQINKLLADSASPSEIKKVKPEIEIVFGMDVPSLIIQSAKKAKASFICTSTRGAGKYEKLLGTTTTELITSSTVPLLAIPVKYKSGDTDRLMFACDFANLTSEMKKVKLLQKQLRASLDVYYYDYMIEVPEIRKRIEKKAAIHKDPRTKFHLQHQEIEKPLAAHFAKDIAAAKPSLFIMFTKPNRNWFDRLFNTSQSRGLAFDAKIPLLIYRKKIKN